MLYNKLKECLKDPRVLGLKRNEILYHEGDQPEHIYFVKNGLIGLFHIAESGKETFLRVFDEGSILGHRAYFAGEEYHATAIALTQSEVYAISKDECTKVCATRPEFLLEILKQVCSDLKSAELRLSGLQDKSADRRIAESLVYMKLKYPEQVWTRKEVAEYSCTTYETVTRLMSKAEEEGVIKKVGRDFEILDIQRLLNNY